MGGSGSESDSVTTPQLLDTNDSIRHLALSVILLVIITEFFDSVYDDSDNDNDSDNDTDRDTDSDSDSETEAETIMVRVEPIGGDEFVSQHVDIGDETVVVKATPVNGDGIVEAFNSLIVHSFDEDAPVIVLNEIHNAAIDDTNNILTTTDGSNKYHCLMIKEDTVDQENDPLRRLVDFIKEYAPSYGMMHNDLHLGNVMYNTDTGTLTMLGLSKMSFFRNIESVSDISEQVTDTILVDESYVDNKSYECNAVRSLDIEHSDTDDAIVNRRYLPDIMTLGMYMYTKVVRRYPDMAIPIFRKSKDGDLIGKERIAIDEINVHSFWEPILEGILAYAVYSQNMFDTRGKYFKLYTPRGTMEAKLNMEEFLESYNELEYSNEFTDDHTDTTDIYAALFPHSLEEAYNHKWRSVRSKEHRLDDTTHGGGGSHGANFLNVALFLTTAVCAVVSSTRMIQ